MDDVDADADLSSPPAVTLFGGRLDDVPSAEDPHDPTRATSVVDTAQESKERPGGEEEGGAPDGA